MRIPQYMKKQSQLVHLQQIVAATNENLYKIRPIMNQIFREAQSNVHEK